MIFKRFILACSLIKIDPSAFNHILKKNPANRSHSKGFRSFIPRRNWTTCFRHPANPGYCSGKTSNGKGKSNQHDRKYGDRHRRYRTVQEIWPISWPKLQRLKRSDPEMILFRYILTRNANAQDRICKTLKDHDLFPDRGAVWFINLQHINATFKSAQIEPVGAKIIH